MGLGENQWNRLLFDRDKTKYEIWKTTFLGHLCMLDLKDFIFGKNLNGNETDMEKNEKAYTK